ncbi:hypothetical protein EON83_27295 [bacterium]|nr:MAG: hypothetical protein EON83_27295 [bacterium]
MTEQEAEVWAARITRIWGVTNVRMYSYNDQPNSFRYEGRFEHEGFPAFLSLDNKGGTLCCRFGWSHLHLEVGPQSGIIVSDQTPPHSNANGRTQSDYWLPTFRRNCWLSGVPIEATAHEKAEWMRGYTREEIEAWNLKM